MARNRKPLAPPDPSVTIEIGTDADESFSSFYAVASRFSGGGGKDTLNGSIRSDVLDGGDGNDWIYDGDLFGTAAVSDTLLGGAGDDFIFSKGLGSVIDGGGGIDRAFIDLTMAGFAIVMSGDAASASGVALSDGTVLRGLEYLSLSSGAGNDVLSLGGAFGALSGNAGNDTLFGGVSGDTLDGGAGSDRVDGGGGADVLNGGAGTDQLTGGAGADLFRRSDLGGSALDRILDFNTAEGDRYDAVLFLAEEVNDSAVRVEDPLAEGVARLSDTASGVLIEVDGGGGFLAAALLVGTTLAVTGIDIFV